MPSRGSKSKAKRHETRSPQDSERAGGPDQNILVRDVDMAPGWNAVVTVLCQVLEIPDLTTRSGLKKVHMNFDVLHDRLEKLYRDHASNEKITAAVIGIYAKMCVDSILRDKLFKAGLISKVMLMLDKESCRNLALRSMALITHHGGVEVRQEIARQSSPLVRVIENHPTDTTACELAIVTLSHSCCAVTDVDAKHVAKKDMPRILRAVANQIRQPSASGLLVNHALGLFSGVTAQCFSAFHANPFAINLLVASLRSSDMTIRCNSLMGLMRLFLHNSQEERPTFDPIKLVATIQNKIPSHLSEVMWNYGPHRCETTILLRTTGDYTRVMMDTIRTQNMCTLGQALAKLITRTEFSIADGYYEVEDPTTGVRSHDNMGLPFRRWPDALPACAKKIRSKNEVTPAELDQADILDIKYMIMNIRPMDAVRLAKKAIERNSSVAYFYYAITLSSDIREGLRAAKKGLKCEGKTLTPFLRFQMMARAVELAAELGLEIVQDWARNNRLGEGIAFLASAYEDAKVFIGEAPPDNRNMKNVLYWFILLSITLKGPELSEGLDELSEYFEKLKISHEFVALIWAPLFRTQLHLTQQLVIKQYKEAVQEWGTVITRFDESQAEAGVGKGNDSFSVQAADELEAWLNEMRLDDEDEGHGSEASPTACFHPHLTGNLDSVTLYRCCWCGNTSAGLRKCSGCSKTRYCDAACQKAHWKSHKSSCRPQT